MQEQNRNNLDAVTGAFQAEAKPDAPGSKPGKTFKGEVPEGCLDDRCEIVMTPEEEAVLEGLGTPGPGVGAD